MKNTFLLFEDNLKKNTASLKMMLNILRVKLKKLRNTVYNIFTL